LSQESKTFLYYMSVLCLSNSILLLSVRARDSMGNAIFLKILMQLVVFSPTIRLEGFNFCVKKQLNMFLKLKKDRLNIRFIFNEVNPSKATIIVKEAHIVLITVYRFYC
jgi:hypothetical protein